MFIRNALLMVLLVVLSSFVMPFSFGQDKSIAGHAERPGPFQLFDNLFLLVQIPRPFGFSRLIKG